MSKEIEETIKASREMSHKWTPADILAKLLEETGEFSAAIQTERGVLNKQREHREHTFEEAADSFICILDALAETHKDISEEKVLQLLEKWIRLKREKWIVKLTPKKE